MKQSVNGVVTIDSEFGPPLRLTITRADDTLLLSWPVDRIGAALETTLDLSGPHSWLPVEGELVAGSYVVSVEIWVAAEQQYFRLRRSP